MHRIISIGAAALFAATSSLVAAPPAQADDAVTYEVVSDTIEVVDFLEYHDQFGRKALRNVALPWRTDVNVGDAYGEPPGGAQLRADWRPSAGASKWLTLRIYRAGKIICQSTLDIGDATCYGITPFIS